MKKRFLSIALAGALAATALVGCGKSEDPKKEETKAPSGQEESKAPSGDAKGSVYYLNFKPEQDKAWKKLAEVYTAETGVPVTVITAAGGKYEETLGTEIVKEECPTLFQVNGPVGLSTWKEYCYDLKDSAVYKELTSDSFALKEDDSVYGIAYVIESYGLITNKTLLEKAGYKVEDIKSFDKLKEIAEDITARSSELGFSAFTSAGMDGTSDWRFKTHLANLPLYLEYRADKIGSTDAIKGTYLKNYRNIWDLYINNATCAPSELASKTGGDALNDFTSGKAVFYQNGSWAYGDCKAGGLKDEELQMIPIYVGGEDEANQGLCTGTENYWCVNKKAKAENIQATLDFIYWCVSSETGTKALATGVEGLELGKDEANFSFVIPFKNAAPSDNLFVKQDTEYTNNGLVPVSWNFPTMPGDDWKNGVGSALTAYAANQSDDTWALVEKAFVEGWKLEYEKLNAK